MRPDPALLEDTILGMGRVDEEGLFILVDLLGEVGLNRGEDRAVGREDLEEGGREWDAR
jgi:hypothetical protein